jgi:alkylation response protein AidB-like acyl-CoA dehydrogenase
MRIGEEGESRDVVTSRKAQVDALLEWLRNDLSQRFDPFVMDERRCVPPHIVLELGNRGLMGLETARAHGGLGLNCGDTMAVVQQLGGIDLTLALLVGVHNVLGIRPIARYAPDALKKNLLPMLATGRGLGAFAITEPGAGSNPRALASHAEPMGQGWRLSGTKVWSGNAGWAASINVFVKMRGLAGGETVTGFTLLHGDKGLDIQGEAMTMGIRGIVQNTVAMKGVTVDAGRMLGTPGQGMDVAYDAMMYARLGLGAMAIGAMKRCTQMMMDYASQRTIGTGLLLDNPVTLKRLNEAVAAIEALENLVELITRRLDEGKAVAPELFVACKTAGPELLWQVVDHGMQTLGGRGYIETNGMARMFRDARLLRIFEGPTETLETFLGMRLLSGKGDIAGVLRSQVGAHKTADRIQEAGERVKAGCMEGPEPASVAMMRAYPAVGRAVTEAVLFACAKVSERRSSETTIAWLEWRLKEAIEATALPGDMGVKRLSKDALCERVASFSKAVGYRSARLEPT